MASSTLEDYRRILTICGFCKENDSELARECFRKLPIERQLYLRLFLNGWQVDEAINIKPKNSGASSGDR